MICINRPRTDPFFNIAAEEYILKNLEESVFMLWQNSPSVVIGKHQNAMAEINLEYISKKGIPVIRRISGGGTVFHDEGNLNYTVITTEKNRERLIDFKKFSLPIIEFLNTLGVEATYQGKNNLVVGNKKISGNAAHVFKNRVMHHGTLLVNSNLDVLDKTIQASRNSFEDKAVQSVRATVGNLNDFLDPKIDVPDFKNLLFNYLMEFHAVVEVKNLSDSQNKEIALLAEEKYKSREWTFGYSPQYTLVSPVELDGQPIEIRLRVVKGLIEKVTIDGETEEINRMRSMLDKIIGLPHHPVDLDLYLRALAGNKSDLKLLKQLLFNIQ